MSKKILIMAGGTGGHVFPALAIAQALRDRHLQIFWLGTPKGIEARVIPPTQIPLHFITVEGIRGKGWRQKLLAPFKVMRAVWQAMTVMRQVQPDLVIGFGGFASGPGGIAAKLLRIPLVIHEQNAVAGITNRLLSPLANQILEAFPKTFPEKRRPVVTGNPVRPDILSVTEPQHRLQDRHGPLHVLVLGGSLGAQSLNQNLPRALNLMAHAHYEVWHQTGEKNLAETEQLYAQHHVKAKVVSFINDMAEAYSWADLVVCRAGASTIAELSAVGIASILIPFPQAVDDHQTHNARYLSQKGAAVLLPQTQLTPEHLAEALQKLSRTQLLQMSITARSLSVPQSTQLVLDHCLTIL